jgi:hypothetical protein
MRKILGLLLIAGAIACAVIAFSSKGSIEHNIESNPRWLAWPAGTLVGLLLGFGLIIGVRRAFGVLFLIGAAACGFFAYVNGGPAWGERFDFNKMLRQGGLWAALGGAVCLVIGLLIVLKKRRPRTAAAERSE